MALTRGRRLAAVAYGALFCVLLPLLAWCWASFCVLVVTWPLPLPRALGWPLAAAGAVWWLWAVFALWRHGGGLPMNAFPPPRYCARGPYRWHAHPIYVGFTVLCLGISLAMGSAIGCYVVTPALACGAAALVLGYESHDLHRRFGALPRPLLTLPLGEEPLRQRDRFAVLGLVLLPWLAAYLWIVAIGTTRDAVAPWLPGEAQWPVWQWSYLPYASAYPVVALAPWWARSARDLAEFARAGRAASVLHMFLYLVVPVVVVPRPFVASSWYGDLLAIEAAREASGAGALPSFHVTWAVLVAVLAARTWPAARGLAWLWASLVTVSCATTGMHAVVDLVAGALTAASVSHRWRIWELLRRGSERVANSFGSWTFGPVRVFVHAPYAGLAAGLVMFCAGRFAGDAGLLPAAILCACGVLGAAAWAQWLEGAAASLRPFGYYGAVVGVGVGLLVLPCVAIDPWPLAGGMCVAAPFAQAIGRLRCLAQGCCHGRPAPGAVGIVCRASLSRVVRLAGLGGVSVHPTQLYSILWNLPLGLVLLRCAQLGQPPSAVAGLYLLGNGLGRFVEEAYRGEPQTRRWGGLAEYQVYALVSVVCGAALTCVPSAWPPSAALSAGLVWASLAVGMATAVAMGVDFPGSDRRFARLVK